MADPRKPHTVLLLRKRGKQNVKIELFDASLFEQSRSGQVRIRIDGRWADPSYLTPEAMTRFVGQMLLEGVAVAQPAPRPDLPKGSRVRVRNGNHGPDGSPRHDLTFTRTPPFQSRDGRWYVFVTRISGGDCPLPCDAVQRIDD